MRRRILRATTLACAIPGLAALLAPVAAISPTANMFGALLSEIWSVGRTEMNPLLVIEFGDNVEMREDCGV